MHRITLNMHKILLLQMIPHSKHNKNFQFKTIYNNKRSVFWLA